MLSNNKLNSINKQILSTILSKFSEDEVIERSKETRK